VRSERRQGKAMWCGGCSPTSMADIYVWSMATPFDARQRARMIEIENRSSRYGGGLSRRSKRKLRITARASAPELDADPFSVVGFRQESRTSFRLSGFLAALRQKLSRCCPTDSRSNRIGVHALEVALPSRNRDARIRAPGRFVQQGSIPGATAFVSSHHPEAVSLEEAAALLYCHRHRSGADSRRLAVPLIGTYIRAGTVPRFPTAILSLACDSAVLSVSSGLVLDTVTRGRREMKVAGLSVPARNQ